MYGSYERNGERKTSVRKRKAVRPSSYLVKSFLMTESDLCRLPSCSRRGNAGDFRMHHWDFRGQREDPLYNPWAVHLVHSVCHDRIHKIAGSIVYYLENYISTKRNILIRRMLIMLENEVVENIRFVLREELIPANLILVKNGKYELNTESQNSLTIRNIKKYLEIEQAFPA